MRGCNAWHLGEGDTCRMLKFSTNVHATFAKLLLVAVVGFNEQFFQI